MTWQLVILIIAFVFSLIIGIPLGGAMSLRGARVLGALGAIVCAGLSGVGVYAFAMSINIDPLSYGLGAFFAMTIGAVIGTLLVNFLVAQRDRRPTSAHIEY